MQILQIYSRRWRWAGLSFAFGYSTNTRTHTSTHTHKYSHTGHSHRRLIMSSKVANKFCPSCGLQIKINIYIPFGVPSLPSLSLSLTLTPCKGKLCVKSVGIFVNLKQQELKPKPNPNQTPAKQSEASARQNRLPTDWLHGMMITMMLMIMMIGWQQ